MYGASAWRCCAGVGAAGSSLGVGCGGVVCESGACAAQFSAASTKTSVREKPTRDMLARLMTNGEPSWVSLRMRSAGTKHAHSMSAAAPELSVEGCIYGESYR